ncbi:MAG: PAS domain S-box protein, partial [Oxalobacteraceae bacterium]
MGPSDAYCRAAWSAVCTSQAVIEFDTNGIITWANVGFLKLVRYQLSDLVGQHHRVLCYPEQTKTEEYRRLWKSLGDGRFDSGEYARRRSDGSEIWLQATYNPVFDEDGSVQRVIKIATDVTRRVALEQSAKIHLDNET